MQEFCAFHETTTVDCSHKCFLFDSSPSTNMQSRLFYEIFLLMFLEIIYTLRAVLHALNLETCESKRYFYFLGFQNLKYMKK